MQIDEHAFVRFINHQNLSQWGYFLNTPINTGSKFQTKKNEDQFLKNIQCILRGEWSIFMECSLFDSSDKLLDCKVGFFPVYNEKGNKKKLPLVNTLIVEIS